MGDTPKFDDFCRICAEEFNCSLYVFSEAGKQLLLQDRIQKYLTIVINIDDKLPKMICANCITRLDGIDKFARLALRAQERFTALMNNDEGMFSTLKSDTDDVDSEMCAIETMSNVDFNHETEPDIKIDPLLYVQCSLDDSINSEDSPQSSPKKFNADTIALLGDHNYFISNEDERILSPLQYQDCFKIENETDYDSNDIVKLLITDHDNIEKFYCTSCPQVFSNDTDLRNHMWRHLFKSHNITIETSDSLQSDNKIVIPETSASREPVHVPCPICGKRLSTKGNLKVHLETHSPKGKYECNICGRIFRSESNLCSHKEYHTVSYKFTCEVCRRVYPTSSTLRAHSITHSDARPHACSLCNKTFKRNQDLKFHLNQHTGARPYQCPYCPKAFASSGNCFSHRKRMHPSEVERDRERAAAAIAK